MIKNSILYLLFRGIIFDFNQCSENASISSTLSENKMFQNSTPESFTSAQTTMSTKSTFQTPFSSHDLVTQNDSLPTVKVGNLVSVTTEFSSSSTLNEMSCFDPSFALCGHTFRVESNVTTFESCQRLCNQSSDCFVWTWMPDTGSFGSDMCYLKSQKAVCNRRVAQMEDVVSGTKDCDIG